MIFDEIANWQNYLSCYNEVDEIVKVLQTINEKTPNGEYRVNDNCYYKIMTYDTKINPKVIESHKKEIDIQVLLSGKEHIKIYSRGKVETIEKYDSKTDCEFYKDIEGADLELNLVPGKMAIFFPQDIHGCQHAISNKEETIKKIVFKIDEKFFTRKE